jgi:hypothetical protein
LFRCSVLWWSRFCFDTWLGILLSSGWFSWYILSRRHALGSWFWCTCGTIHVRCSPWVITSKYILIVNCSWSASKFECSILLTIAVKINTSYKFRTTSRLWIESRQNTLKIGFGSFLVCWWFHIFDILRRFLSSCQLR